jgi:dihydroxyacetone kinase-like protein
VLKQVGIRIYDTVVGSYCTCQEMAGFSLSLLRLNPELKGYYDMPARSLAFNRGHWDA